MSYCCEHLKEKMSKDELGATRINFFRGNLLVVGCCDHCYVLEDLVFCPYCGYDTRLNEYTLKDDEVTA